METTSTPVSSDLAPAGYKRITSWSTNSTIFLQKKRGKGLMMKCPSLGDHKSGPISPIVTPLSLPRSSASVPFFQTTTAFLLQLNVQNHTINNTQNTLYLSCTLVSTLLKLHLYSCKFTFNSVDQNFLQKQCHLPLTLYECEQKLPAKKINNKYTSCFCLLFQS